MKILFLTYHGFEEASGISKKMLAQIKGLRQNGHDVRVCSYDISSSGDHCRYVDNHVIMNYGKGRWATIRQRMEYGCIYDYCVQNKIQLVYVRCFMNASPFNIRLFRRLHSVGIKSVMEVPTYPYDKEMETLPFKYRFEHVFDKIFRRQLASYMDAIVTFTVEKEIFGQRTICISNGVDLDSIPLHQPSSTSHQPSELHLIGVAEVHPWHGFDRLIAGIGEYYKTQLSNHNPQFVKVYFHIVGGVLDNIMCQFKQIIKQYQIAPYVIFHGKLFGEQLTKVFSQCQFAIGSLARHRSGITHIKTLKNREYACRGIPFAYSECDSDFDHQPYVLKVPADESPVDMLSILSFYEHQRLTPAEIRQTIIHLSWKEQMQRVIEQVQINTSCYDT